MTYLRFMELWLLCGAVSVLVQVQLVRWPRHQLHGYFARLWLHERGAYLAWMALELLIGPVDLLVMAVKLAAGLWLMHGRRYVVFAAQLLAWLARWAWWWLRAMLHVGTQSLTARRDYRIRGGDARSGSHGDKSPEQ